MIDWARVGELRDDTGDIGFPEVSELFLTELADATDRLVAGVAPGTLAAELNAVATGALNLGLSELAELAADGRDMAMIGQGEGFDLLLLRQVFHDSRACFLAATSGPPALRLVG